ncbi:MAG: aspartate 1-decarboxylase [Calditrichia bacterium]
MNRLFLKSKIHRATITQSDLHYEGSISIDENLMDAANIARYEKVEIYNISNGQRLATYAIPAERGSGIIGLNGAAARLGHSGDLIIIASYCYLEENEIAEHEPVLLLADRNNRIKSIEKVAL